MSDAGIEFAMEELAALIEQARREHKALWCPYQDLWFSADELSAENAKGSFRWGVVNWTLRDPQERVTAAADRLSDAADNHNRMVSWADQFHK